MITVKEVSTRRENKLFVTFPDRLYKDNPYYVPGFKSDDYSDWNKKDNPAFSYCDVKRFLAWRDGEVVGRIAAILSHRANEKWGTSRMRFSSVDFIDDREVSAALFEAVECFAREKGCKEIHGPLGFTDLDREGLLIDGFEEKGLFFTYYNAPYYKEHIEALGYGKDVDWVELLLECPPADAKEMTLLKRVAERAERQHGFHVAPIKNNRGFKPYIERAFELVNAAYGDLYGTVPLDEAQVKRYAKKFVPLVDPDFACIVLSEAGVPVGFGATAPNLSDAFRKTGGKLFPFGWISTLWALKHPKMVDLFLIAVLPEYQNKGINAIIINHIFKNACRRGILGAETGPQLEENEKVLSQWKMLVRRQHKRRRCFIKQLTDGAIDASGNETEDKGE